MITEYIECPKCNKEKLAYSHPESILQWTCFHCFTAFSTDELVNRWGLDAGDLFGLNGDVPNILLSPISFLSPKYYEVETGEPYWLSGKERNSAYQMVQRMFLDIPELDDYADMLATQEDALGIGVQ